MEGTPNDMLRASLSGETLPEVPEAHFSAGEATPMLPTADTPGIDPVIPPPNAPPVAAPDDPSDDDEPPSYLTEAHGDDVPASPASPRPPLCPDFRSRIHLRWWESPEERHQRQITTRADRERKAVARRRIANTMRRHRKFEKTAEAARRQRRRVYFERGDR